MVNFPKYVDRVGVLDNFLRAKTFQIEQVRDLSIKILFG